MSVEAEKRIGRNANAGSAHTAANFNSKLLLPIPQSPRIANELVRPAVSPCCKASRNASMWWLRPTNSSGLTGKLGSGRMSDLQNHRSDACQRIFVTFVTFVTFAGLHGRRHEHTPPTVQRWKELFGGSCCLWVGSLRGLVRGFGNEGVVLNQGTVDHGFRPVDPELDECKRDPIVAFLDHAGFAENDFLRYEVMREAVFFTCHKAPPVFGFFVFVDLCVLSWPELCFGWGLVGLAAPLLRL